MSQNFEVAVELKAQATAFAQAINKASSDFQNAMGGMESTAKQTGDSVEQAMEKIGMRRHSEIDAEIAQVEQAYKDLAASGKLTEQELAQAGQKTEQTIRQLRGSTSSWKESLGAMKGELIAAGAALYGLQRALGAIGKASSEFQTSMAEVSTLLDDTSGMDGLTNSVREMAREFGGSAAGQAKALYQIISAGASDAAAATELLTVANKLAVGGVTDVETAADGLTSILNAYGKEASEAGTVSDMMFTAMKAGKTTIEELSGSIGQVAPAAAQAGISIDEILSATAALTKGGLSTSEAMTQLKGVIQGVVKPTNEAAETAERLEFQFDTAAIKAQGFAGFLESVTEATGGSEAEMAKLFGGVEALNGIFALTGNAAGDFAATLAGMEASAGNTEQAFAKMVDTPQMAMERFKAALDDVKITLGETVTAFSPVLEALTGALNAFNDLPDPIRNTAGAIGVLSGTLGVVGMAVGSLVKSLVILRGAFIMQGGVSAFSGGLTVATAATTAATTATKLLTLALRAVPWVAIAATSASAVGALANWHEGASRAREATNALSEQSERFAAKLADVSSQTGRTITTMERFNALVEQGKIIFDAATQQWVNAADHQTALALAAEQAAAAQAKLNEEQARLNEQMQSAPYREEAENIVAIGLAMQGWRERIEEIDPAAEGAQAAVKKLVDAAKIGDTIEMAGLIRALGRIREEAPELADLVQNQIIASIKELDAQDLSTLTATLRAAFDAGTLSAEQFAATAQGAIAAAAERMGIDLGTALGTTTAATERALADLSTLEQGLRGLGATSAQQSQIISNAIAGAFQNARTMADIDAINARVRALGQAGLISSQEIETIGVASDRAAQRVQTAAAIASSGFVNIAREAESAADVVRIIGANISDAANAADFSRITAQIAHFGQTGVLTANQVAALTQQLVNQRQVLQGQAGSADDAAAATWRLKQAQDALGNGTEEVGDQVENTGRQFRRTGFSVDLTAEAMKKFKAEVAAINTMNPSGYVRRYAEALNRAVAETKAVRDAEIEKREAMEYARETTERYTETLTQLRREHQLYAGESISDTDDVLRANQKLREELMLLRGQEQELAVQRQRNARLDIELQIRAAELAGDNALARALREQLSLMERVRMEQAFQEQQRNTEIDQARRLNEVEKSRSSGLSKAAGEVTQAANKLSNAEVRNSLVVEFKRDQGEQVVISEDQITRIASRVLDAIDVDRGRTA